jgi:dolichyl-phosphate beta-glucosyltransferase
MTSENVHGTERINNWIDQQPVTSPRVDLSVVIPAYNEERRLPPTLIDVIDFFDRKSISYEVVVIDDGSTDGTAEVVRKFERVRNQVRLIQLPRNYGKGHAVRLGVLNCRGSCILFADADGATPIQEFDRLKAAISEGADVAIGSRALASTETKVATSLHRRFLGRVFNKCVNMILLPSIADTQCGFKMFTRKAALFLFRRQRADRFSFDVELLYMAHKANLAIKEVPINWTNVPGSKVNLVLDSLSMFRDVFRFRVIHRGIDHECFDQFEEQIAETPNT